MARGATTDMHRADAIDCLVKYDIQDVLIEFHVGKNHFGSICQKFDAGIWYILVYIILAINAPTVTTDVVTPRHVTTHHQIMTKAAGCVRACARARVRAWAQYLIRD